MGRISVMRACEDKRVRPHVYREPCSQLKCVEFVFVIKKIKTKSLYIIEIFDPNQCGVFGHSKVRGGADSARTVSLPIMASFFTQISQT